MAIQKKLTKQARRRRRDLMCLKYGGNPHIETDKQKTDRLGKIHTKTRTLRDEWISLIISLGANRKEAEKAWSDSMGDRE